MQFGALLEPHVGWVYGQKVPDFGDLWGLVAVVGWAPHLKKEPVESMVAEVLYTISIRQRLIHTLKCLPLSSGRLGTKVPPFPDTGPYC